MKTTLIRLPLIAAVLLCIAWGLGQVLPLPVLKLLHVVAFVTLGAGLIGVLVCDVRARQAANLAQLVDGIEAMLTFYYRVAVPGSLLVFLSGFSMVFGYYGWAALQLPWLTGMMVIFAFEFFEGHLIMKAHYLKLREGVQRARQANAPVPELTQELHARLTLATHFLDVPNLALLITLGMLRPNDWTVFTVGLLLVVAATTWLVVAVPRRLPWGGLAPSQPAQGVSSAAGVAS